MKVPTFFMLEIKTTGSGIGPESDSCCCFKKKKRPASAQSSQLPRLVTDPSEASSNSEDLTTEDRSAKSTCSRELRISVEAERGARETLWMQSCAAHTSGSSSSTVCSIIVPGSI